MGAAFAWIKSPRLRYMGGKEDIGWEGGKAILIPTLTGRSPLPFIKSLAAQFCVCLQHELHITELSDIKNRMGKPLLYALCLLAFLL